MPKLNRRSVRVAVTAGLVALAAAASATAFQALPPGAQVNDDPIAGIDKTKSVDGGRGHSDVVGGAVVAGNPAVPWATFRQETTGADQVWAAS